MTRPGIRLRNLRILSDKNTTALILSDNPNPQVFISSLLSACSACLVVVTILETESIITEFEDILLEALLA